MKLILPYTENKSMFINIPIFKCLVQTFLNTQNHLQKWTYCDQHVPQNYIRTAVHEKKEI